MAAGLSISRLQEIREWHGKWQRAACDDARRCIAACDGVSEASAMVKALIGNKELAEKFGSPVRDGILCPTSHSYDSWLGKLWGRRCSYYLSNLLVGLAKAEELQPADPDLQKTIKSLERLDIALSEEFKRTWNHGITPEKSLKSRRDIANFHRTYLDPILFSALYYLHQNRNEGHNTDPDAESILWELIVEEVEFSTEHGNGKSDQLVDDSTVWWGVVELAAKYGADFRVGEHTGWSGVVEVCRNLIHSNGGNIRAPQPSETLHEATAEIYGDLRTRILIAMNLIRLGTLIPPERFTAELRNDLDRLLERLCVFVLSKSSMVASHLCWLGLALQFTAYTLKTMSSHCSIGTLPDSNLRRPVLNERPRTFAGASGHLVVLKLANQPRPTLKPDLTESEVAELRVKRDSFDLYVDETVVYVRSKTGASVPLEIYPSTRILLMMFLRYGSQPLDPEDQYQKLRVANSTKPTRPLDNLATEVARLRDRLSKHLDSSKFDIPFKPRGKQDTGYCCLGDFTSCLIIDASKQPTIEVKPSNSPLVGRRRY